MVDTMKAAVLMSAGDVQYKAVPVPEISDDDFLIKVAYSGVCGSDLPRSQKENGARLYPLIMGHEFSGTVAKMGANIKGFKEGEHVAVAPLLPNPDSIYTKMGLYGFSEHYNLIGTGSNGGFAEFVRVPKGHVLHLPDSVDLKTAAGIEPATVSGYGLARGHIQAGDTVAILGCGSIGQFAIQNAKLYGASNVIAVDIFDDKLELAKKLGADYTINGKTQDVVAEVQKITKHGVDVAVDCAGTRFTEIEALEITRRDGNVVFVGISGDNLPIEKDVFEQHVLRGGLNIHGSWMSYTMPYPGRAWSIVIDAMSKGKMDFKSMISQEINLNELGDTLKKMYNKEIEFNKVIVKVDSSIA
ncbi:MAG: galactitol-1-phosphate 5-dehydrogenase [Lacticaseibacillus paracasei]